MPGLFANLIIWAPHTVSQALFEGLVSIPGTASRQRLGATWRAIMFKLMMRLATVLAGVLFAGCFQSPASSQVIPRFSDKPRCDLFDIVQLCAPNVLFPFVGGEIGFVNGTNKFAVTPPLGIDTTGGFGGLNFGALVVPNNNFL